MDISLDSELKKLFGPTTRWKRGDVLYARNDWATMAYVVTDDPALVGKTILHGNTLFVEGIDAATAALWDGVEERVG